MANKQITFSETTLNTISELQTFYDEVYINCFPNENERESFDSILKYLQKAEMNEAYSFHIVFAKDEHGNIIAGAIFNYFKHSNCGVIEFLAVKQNLQSRGIGTKLYHHVVSMLQADASRHGHKKPLYIFCEIDSPEYSKDEVKKYLHFWGKHRYKRILMNYIQPPLSNSQKSVHGLWLIATSWDERLDKLSSQIVLDVIFDYFHYAFDIPNPDDNEEFRQIKNELLQSAFVDASDIFKSK